MLGVLEGSAVRAKLLKVFHVGRAFSCVESGCLIGFAHRGGFRVDHTAFAGVALPPV